MSAPSKTLTLAQALSITTGYLLVPMEEVYEVLNFLTRDNLFTHQLPRAAKSAGPWLLEMFPARLVHATGEAHEAAKADDWKETCLAWVRGATLKYGDAFDVAPLPEDRWIFREPLSELAEMVGPERIVVVATGEQTS